MTSSKLVHVVALPTCGGTEKRFRCLETARIFPHGRDHILTTAALIIGRCKAQRIFIQAHEVFPYLPVERFQRAPAEDRRALHEAADGQAWREFSHLRPGA